MCIMLSFQYMRTFEISSLGLTNIAIHTYHSFLVGILKILLRDFKIYIILLTVVTITSNARLGCILPT